MPRSRPEPSPSSPPLDARVRHLGSVLLCSCCGRVEVRLEGVRFMLDPCDLPSILDQLDDLEDRGGGALARRFLVGIGEPRVQLELSWKGVEALKLLLLAALDDIDRLRPTPTPAAVLRAPSLN